MIERMPLISLVAARLKELRNRHFLTQEEAAEATGVSLRFYQHLESGRKKQIWLDTVDRLASAYKLEAWQLLGPHLPADSELVRSVTESNIHYRRTRRSPYRKPDSPPDA